MNSPRIVILDASGIINISYINSYNFEFYTVPNVVKECKDLKSKAIIESGQIKIIQPKEEFLNKVKEIVKNCNYKNILSETDIEVIALALEFKVQGLNPLVITDDYSIQNILSILEIDFQDVIRGKIKKVWKKLKYICMKCKKVSYSRICPECGSVCKVLKK